jgi:F-type H+-transporting ATPase subunit alpha
MLNQPPLSEREQVARVRDEVRAQLADVHWAVRHSDVGVVSRVGDGVAYAQGLPAVRYGELLEAPGGLTGLTFDILPNEVGVLFLDPSEHIGAGDELAATGRVASVAVGEALLGRVVDALGRPLDNGGPIRTQTLWPVEREAPGVDERLPVHEPLLTGVKIIDALLPLGRGQRELLLGDHATGKTSLVLDAILAQRDTDVLCIYTAIGQRRATVVEVMATLRAHGALARTIVVVADADAPPGHQYLAPYAACTMGEYLMAQGRHVLVIYDDLTKHADAYRRIALLFGRPPAREAYPADVFYLHARLLERATRLQDRLGGGSLTALPIAETQAGNISAYIPTNLISITDGQIYLSTRLFNEGIRPAIDVGLSVSRVGGHAQPPLLRAVGGDLRLSYAQLSDLEVFARFGAALESEARARLERGRRLREAFKQPRLAPLRLSLQAATLAALRGGYLDALETAQVGAFLSALQQTLEQTDADLLATIDREGDVGESSELRLRQALEAVHHRFGTGGTA